MRHGRYAVLAVLVVLAGCASSPQPAPLPPAPKQALAPPQPTERPPTVEVAVKGGTPREAPRRESDAARGERAAALEAKLRADAKAPKDDAAQGGVEGDPTGYARSSLRVTLGEFADPNPPVQQHRPRAQQMSKAELDSCLAAQRAMAGRPAPYETSGRRSLTVKNEGQRAVRSVRVVVFYLDANDRPVDEDEITVPDDGSTLKPGYAKSVRWVKPRVPGEGKPPRFEVKAVTFAD